MKHSGPLLGYNNNIPYKGQVFHVQTEDSGSKRPHVFTHLFADGGRIVKTMKTSYQHFVGAENAPEKVRALMREQHKAMVISLRDGELDVLIEEGRAEIEEREAPRTQPPPPAEEETAPPAAAADDDDEEQRSSRPIDLLERAAAEDDSDFIKEIDQLVPEKRGAPSDRSAGTYSFVGQKGNSGPPKRSSPPPRRMKATRPPGTSSPPGDEPPAVDVAPSAPAVRPRRPSAAKGDGKAARTDPDLKVAHQHAAARAAFGLAYMSEYRFDKIVRAFLERQ